jgi:hypothetical protein
MGALVYVTHIDTGPFPVLVVIQKSKQMGRPAKPRGAPFLFALLICLRRVAERRYLGWRAAEPMQSGLRQVQLWKIRHPCFGVGFQHHSLFADLNRTQAFTADMAVKGFSAHAVLFAKLSDAKSERLYLNVDDTHVESSLPRHESVTTHHN